MKGIVLQTYGAGNGPDSRKEILELLRQASKRGMIIVNITQCQRGKVSAAYAAGKALEEAGVVPGGDMTPEAALMKLSYVLSKDELDLATKRKVTAFLTSVRFYLHPKHWFSKFHHENVSVL